MSNSTGAAPTMSIETVTPDAAEAWLGRNTHNRSTRRSLVTMYAQDMADGNWQFTGEAIKFAYDGTLLDGQHRLLAVKTAGVPIAMLVVRGLRSGAQHVMDTGAKRTASDALSLKGERSSPLLAAVAAMVLNDGVRSKRPRTNAELFAVIDNDPYLRDIVQSIMPGLRLQNLMTPAVAAFAYWRLDRIDASDTAKFFDSLSNLTNLPAGSPVLALHRRLSAQHRRSASSSYRHETLTLIYTAWNAWRRGESRTIIKLPTTQDGRIASQEPK